MDFPSEVDCLICGTGLPESIVSASLSVLGKRVLHIDETDYYGGRLASLRFHDFLNAINAEETVDANNEVQTSGTNGCLNLPKPYSVPICHASSRWYLNEESNGISEVCAPPLVEPSTATVLDDASDAMHVESMRSVDPESSATVASDAPSPSPPTPAVEWTRSNLEQRMRRVDLDLLPKIIYAESPTVTALLRADVTRYLEFRFISRLLALTVPPSASGTAPTVPGYDTVSSSTHTEPTGAATASTGLCAGNQLSEFAQLVQIPVCRSEVFKTRLLSLRQKRALVSFFEWCFHLPLDQSEAPSPTTPGTDVYNAYAHRPLRELLTKERNLDSFTQQLVINNLALGSEDITTEEAVRRIRRLLLSMNRFGPYPLLWPMYGCGDLPQAYCRMSAVFGAVFCLNCSVRSIRHWENQSGDTLCPRVDGAEGASRPPPNFIVQLTNGHEVRTQCIVIGAEQAPTEWVQPQVQRWCARAVFLTDRSLLPDGRKSSDITMLAVPLSGRGEAGLDPAILLEIPTETIRKSDPELFMVHLSATVKVATDPEQLFRPIVLRLFQMYDASKQSASPAPSDTTDSVLQPNVLWASYFCLPDLSGVQMTVPQPSGSSRFGNADGLYVAPGPDCGVHLDSTAITAETIFRGLASHLGIRSTEQPTIHAPRPVDADGGSDGPPLSSLTSSNGSTVPESPATTPYLSLDARWDGLFPPRPPRPEEIVLPTDTEEPLDAPGINTSSLGLV